MTRSQIYFYNFKNYVQFQKDFAVDIPSKPVHTKSDSEHLRLNQYIKISQFIKPTMKEKPETVNVTCLCYLQVNS